MEIYKILNVIVLVFLFIIFYVITRYELMDIYCSRGFEGGLRGDGMGKHLYQGIPSEDDNVKDSIKKIIPEANKEAINILSNFSLLVSSLVIFPIKSIPSKNSVLNFNAEKKLFTKFIDHKQLTITHKIKVISSL